MLIKQLLGHCPVEKVVFGLEHLLLLLRIHRTGRLVIRSFYSGSSLSGHSGQKNLVCFGEVDL